MMVMLCHNYIYIAWSSVEGTWCVSDNMGKKLASMDAKLAKFGFEKVNVPDGHVSVPALNPSYGSSGKAKFRCVACKLVDQYASQKKGRLWLQHPARQLVPNLNLPGLFLGVQLH